MVYLLTAPVLLIGMEAMTVCSSMSMRRRGVVPTGNLQEKEPKLRLGVAKARREDPSRSHTSCPNMQVPWWLNGSANKLWGFLWQSTHLYSPQAQLPHITRKVTRFEHRNSCICQLSLPFSYSFPPCSSKPPLSSVFHYCLGRQRSEGSWFSSSSPTWTTWAGKFKPDCFRVLGDRVLGCMGGMEAKTGKKWWAPFLVIL